MEKGVQGVSARGAYKLIEAGRASGQPELSRGALDGRVVRRGWERMNALEENLGGDISKQLALGVATSILPRLSAYVVKYFKLRWATHGRPATGE